MTQQGSHSRNNNPGTHQWARPDNSWTPGTQGTSTADISMYSPGNGGPMSHRAPVSRTQQAPRYNPEKVHAQKSGRGLGLFLLIMTLLLIPISFMEWGEDNVSSDFLITTEYEQRTGMYTTETVKDTQTGEAGDVDFGYSGFGDLGVTFKPLGNTSLSDSVYGFLPTLLIAIVLMIALIAFYQLHSARKYKLGLILGLVSGILLTAWTTVNAVTGTRPLMKLITLTAQGDEGIDYTKPAETFEKALIEGFGPVPDTMSLDLQTSENFSASAGVYLALIIGVVIVVVCAVALIKASIRQSSAVEKTPLVQTNQLRGIPVSNEPTVQRMTAQQRNLQQRPQPERPQSGRRLAQQPGVQSPVQPRAQQIPQVPQVRPPQDRWRP